MEEKLLDRKTCKTCKVTKPLTEFRTMYSKAVDKHYYRPYCKPCQNKMNRVTKEKQPDYKEKHAERLRKSYHHKKATDPMFLEKERIRRQKYREIS